MSSLTGFPKAANGSIVTVAGAPSSFFRAMGTQGDTLCVAASAPGGYNNGSVPMAETGEVMHSTVAAIDVYKSGLPLDANGALCTEVGDAVSFCHGVGFTAGGRVAIT